ncbi:branched-chain amino acid ABC transporter ATP-binding protein/permease [Jiella pacifica]|uniref:ATP-binding cassette domain-containing protein n=1 Tax=Jiella pacifica TaxID=2696469 RepID=A0A6N9T3F5_9HYPH|nr:branched-chain amino acid ABC transporter ATP-binding protein/permease [Jiella pacifica]NDW05903.1 ATP-binding cassette domain-containing protein [Jiella pacifica]
MSTRRIALLVFTAIVLVLPAVLSAYGLTLMNFIGLAAIVVVGLVLLTGIGGLTSFGQASFVGVGAYTTAWLTTAAGLSPVLALPVALFAGAFFALVIGAVTLRLSGHYLPLSTIAWSLSLYFLVGNVAALGGHDGIPAVPPISLFGWEPSGPAYTWLIVAAVALSLLTVANVLASRDGRAVRCLRGRRVMLEAFGVDTARLRLVIFVHAAVLAALTGWLYAHLIQFVNATPFGLNASIEYLFMTVIGGSAHLFGAVIGAGLMTLLRDGLQRLAPELVGSGGATEIVMLGLVMVVLLQTAPRGVMPWLLRLLPPRGRPWMDLDRARAIAPFSSRPKPERGTELLTVAGVTKRFGGLIAVNDVSFDLKAGEILGLIGPNGAGKSTLFNLLTGISPATAGTISFAGERIERMASRKIARLGVARSFQHVLLRSDMSALENVAVGAHLRSTRGYLSALLRLDRREEERLLAEAMRQLDRVGLAHLAHEPAGSLALGQQRILEIARALAADPALLLLDEPAAGLRYREKQELAALLSKLGEEGVAVLVVEHDMNFVMNLVDRLVVISFGQKISEGAPTHVQNDVAVQEAYLGVAA